MNILFLFFESSFFSPTSFSAFSVFKKKKATFKKKTCYRFFFFSFFLFFSFLFVLSFFLSISLFRFRIWNRSTVGTFFLIQLQFFFTEFDCFFCKFHLRKRFLLAFRIVSGLWSGFTGFYRVLPGFTGFYRV